MHCDYSPHLYLITIFDPMRLPLPDQSLFQVLTFKLFYGPFNLIRTICMTFRLGLHIGTWLVQHSLLFFDNFTHVYTELRIFYPPPSLSSQQPRPLKPFFFLTISLIFDDFILKENTQTNKKNPSLRHNCSLVFYRNQILFFIHLPLAT